MYDFNLQNINEQILNVVWKVNKLLTLSTSNFFLSFAVIYFQTRIIFQPGVTLLLIIPKVINGFNHFDTIGKLNKMLTENV